jgi:hypothetical protein
VWCRPKQFPSWQSKGRRRHFRALERLSIGFQVNRAVRIEQYDEVKSQYGGEGWEGGSQGDCRKGAESGERRVNVSLDRGSLVRSVRSEHGRHGG